VADDLRAQHSILALLQLLTCCEVTADCCSDGDVTSPASPGGRLRNIIPHAQQRGWAWMHGSIVRWAGEGAAWRCVSLPRGVNGACLVSSPFYGVVKLFSLLF
jgi:hypothetical protein